MKNVPTDPTEKRQQRQASLNRRAFLSGVGACLALPAFESLRTASRVLADGAPLASTATGAPLRMAYVYFPNGAHQLNWWPSGQDKAFELAKTMLPLAPVKNRIQVLGGLDHKESTAGPDGPGDHARASGTFLTGVRVRKTAGADIHAGPSIDQLTARQVGHLTRFSSLELTCDAVRKSGNCDSGYSCAYQYNLAWKSPTSPVAPEANPRQVFERLFGAGKPEERAASLERRKAQQRSILDFVLEDAADLENRLGQKDKPKLDQYLTSVREIEKRIQQAESFGGTPNPTIDAPNGIPAKFEEHIALMYDMLHIAFQTDSTRIATFLLANEGSNRAFPEIGIPEGHHSLSHHQGKQDMLDKIGQIDAFYMKQFARFLTKMEETKERDGNSLLQNSMIVYGCGNGDGNRHTHSNLPIIVAGGGGGTLTSGRYNRFGGKPMSNLLLSLADRMGVKDLARLGDSTGRIDGL